MALAAMLASVLVLMGGLAYRALAARLGVQVGYKTPIDSAALAHLPFEFNGWTGQNVSMDEAIVRRTGTDVHLSRSYVRQDGTEPASLYIGSGVWVRALVDHRPEVCYVAAGWTLQDHRSVELPLADGRTLPCSLFEFSRGELDRGRRIAVLYYFIVDGERCGDVSAAVAKTGPRYGGADYVAQVHITCTGPLYGDLPTQTLYDFALDSAPLVARLFAEVETNRGSEPIHESSRGQ